MIYTGITMLYEFLYEGMSFYVIYVNSTVLKFHPIRKTNLKVREYLNVFLNK